jgi:hypothetical protein
MTPISVSNLDQVEAWGSGGLPILSPGRHRVRITTADDSEPSTNNNPQIVLDMENDYGRCRDWMTVIAPQPDGTGGNYGKIRQLFEAAGITIQGGNWTLPTDLLVGKTVVVTVAKVPNKQGELKDRVMSYEPGSASVPDNPQQQQVTQTPKSDIPAPTSQFEMAGQRSNGIDDSDIPF